MPPATVPSPQYAGDTARSREVKTTEQIRPHRIRLGTLVSGAPLVTRRHPTSWAEMTTSFPAC